MKIIESIDEIIYLSEAKITISDIENHIRDHLSGTPRGTDKKGMFNLIVSGLKSKGKLIKKDFDKVWKSLIDEDYLKPAGGGAYKWEG